MSIFSELPNQGFEVRAYYGQPIFVTKPKHMIKISFGTKWWWHLIPGKVERERVAFWKTVDEIMAEMETTRERQREMV